MTRFCRSAAIGLAVALLTPVPAKAQNGVDLPLRAPLFEIDRLTPDSPAGSATFDVGACGTIAIHVTATMPLEPRIVRPDGQTIDQSNATAFGGRTFLFEGSDTPDFVPLHPAPPGFHHVFELLCAGTGSYTVHFEAPSGLQEEVAVFTRVTSDSPVAAALAIAPSVVPAGGAAVLGLALYAGEVPVADAEVSASVVPPDAGDPIDVPLRDDGMRPDAAAGDGLYTGELVPDRAGRWIAQARAHVALPDGSAVVRQAGGSFVAAPAVASFTGAVSDEAVDRDLDFFVDLIAVRLGVTVERAGEYRATVELRAGDRFLVRSGLASLTEGAAIIAAEFEAAAFVELGVGGPYDIARADLTYFDDGEPIPADVALDLGVTGAHRLADFHRSPVRYAGPLTEEGIDDDGDGRFDRLTVSFGMDLPRLWRYSWSLHLANDAGEVIASASAKSVLEAGRTALRADFRGGDVFRAGTEGSYQLRELLVRGPAQERFFLLNLGQTRAYDPLAFDPPCNGDCDFDGAVTVEEIVLAVKVRLGDQPAASCLAATDVGGAVSTDGLRAAIGHALEGCPPE